jgi:long-subunit acyl-CoA synthetase (AMP-forming)
MNRSKHRFRMFTFLPLCYSRETVFNNSYRHFGFPSNFVFYESNQSFARELSAFRPAGALLFSS